MIKGDGKAKTIFQLLLFTTIGALILYFMWQSQGAAYQQECIEKGIDLENCSLYDRLINDFKNADFRWLGVISICFFFSQVFRAARWLILLKPMGYQVSFFNSFATIMVGYFANLGIPRIGEFVRAGLISKYEGVAVEKAFATIVIERVIDVLMLLVLLALGFIFHYDSIWNYLSGNMQLSTNTLMIGGSLLLIGGLVGLYILRQILTMDASHLHPLLQKIRNLIVGFVEGLKEVRKLPNVGLFWAYSFGIWIMYFLMHYLAFYSFEPTSGLGPIDAILVFDFGSLGIVFPSPGGMGSYHFMIIESLKIFDIDPVDGFSFAMITFFTLTIFCTIIIGLLSLILLPIVNRKNG